MRKYLLALALLAPALPAAAADILFIGDSHSVGPFGWKMDELLRSVPGARVGTYASCGSIYQWWENGRATTCGYYYKDAAGRLDRGTKAPTPNFPELLSRHSPRLVVVELGANYAGYGDEFAVADMQKLVRRISDAGAACFWITKPDSRKGHDGIPRILELTRRAVTPYCTYFDSTQVTRYPAEGGDGVHYWFPAGMPIADEWARRAFEALTPLLPAPPADAG